jgi:hypothetical protein
MYCFCQYKHGLGRTGDLLGRKQGLDTKAGQPHCST